MDNIKIEKMRVKKHKKMCKDCGISFTYTINNVRKARDLITDELIGLTVACPECGEEYWIV